MHGLAKLYMFEMSWILTDGQSSQQNKEANNNNENDNNNVVDVGKHGRQAGTGIISKHKISVVVLYLQYYLYN